MKRADVQIFLEEIRPGCPTQWINESMLGVAGFQRFTYYEPSLTVTFFQFAECKFDFDGMVFRTQFAGPDEVSLKFVNDLNCEFNFVRHSAQGSNLIVELDMPLNSDCLTRELLHLNYTLFTVATDRLFSTLPRPESEKED